MEQNNNGYNSNFNNGNVGSYNMNQESVEERVQTTVSKTFLFMFVVLLVSASSAFATYSNPDLFRFMLKNYILFAVVEIAIVIASNFIISKGNIILSAITLLAYSVVNGMTLASIFAIYELGSITSIFVIAAVMFGVVAVFGLVTKKDLTTIGTIGMMGLVGIIIIGICNFLFFKSAGVSLMLAVVGLAVFIGLTAYDLQRIKRIAASNINTSTTSIAMMGALILYLDFINIFLKLLRLFGNNRD